MKGFCVNKSLKKPDEYVENFDESVVVKSSKYTICADNQLVIKH